LQGTDRIVAAVDGHGPVRVTERGAWAAYALCGLTLFAGLWAGAGWGGTDPAVVASAATVVAALGGMVLAWRTAGYFDLPPIRCRAWRCVALALAPVALGEVLELALDRLGFGGTLAIAIRSLRLAFYPVLAAALILFIVSTRRSTPQARFWLDTFAVLLSFGAPLWFFVLAPLDGARDPAITLEAALDSGLFLLASVALLGRTARFRSTALAWLAAGVALLLAGDLPPAAGPAYGAVFGVLPAGILHAAAYALLAVAAQADFAGACRVDPVHPASSRGQEDAGLLPFAGLLLAMAGLVYHQLDAWTEPSGAFAAVVCLAGLLVLARQFLATREVANHEAGLARRAAEERFSSLVRNSSDAIAIVDEAGRMFYVTPSAERVFGRHVEDLAGKRLTELVAVEDRARLRVFFTRSLEPPGATETIELKVPRGNDRHRIIEVVGTNLTHEPAVGGWVANIRDITDRKVLEDQLKRLAFHDPLTLLANRALFRDRVEHALAVSRRRDSRVAAIFVDLDNFKKINDSLGHGEGDRVLRSTAQRLSKCTRTGDTVARLGGDEFAVLMEDVAREEDVVEAAARIVEALKEPFAFSGSSLRVAASVGVAFAAEGEGVEELLRNADVAMYHAKEAGKSRYSVFQPQMQQAVRDRLRIEAELTRAIHRNELRLMFQPIVDLESGYLLGVEALVRWQHPERGLIAPAEFIGVAEETGQVVGLGRWVLHEACTQVRAWQERMPMGRQLRVAVNVSGQQLQGSDLVAEVTGALAETGLDAGCLVLEMTESVVMQDTEATFAKLSKLKRLGIRIAIDDFGTGYSSLSYLHRFPIDILKIDRSFVQRLGEERDGTELARAIITLGETLGLEVVAEGIEYEHQLRQLVELGCVAGQGFYYSKPALLREIEYSHHARLRQDYVRDLPPEAGVSATGRFQRPVFDDLPLDLDATGSFGR